MRRWLVVSSVVAGCAIASPASAQRDPAAAEALFRDAKRALDAGDLATACAKFRDSNDLDPAVGTLYHLADCEEKRGRTGTAWALFVEVKEKLEQSDERKLIVTGRIADLEPKLSRLTITLASPVPGVSIKRSGLAVGSASLNTPVVVDPGKQDISVEAPGYAVKRFAVDVPAAGSAEIAVTVGEKLPDPVPPEAPEERMSLHPIGLALLGVGLAGVGAGIAVGVVAKGKYSDADSRCPSNACDDEGFEQRKDAITLSYVGTGVFFGGIALIAAGGVLEIVELTSDSGADAGALVPFVVPGGAGVRGAF